ncbi:DUF3138 family protein [Curvibacter sp. APW13]|uniref:DUF3138 family protein n=1 Tax=Curvibacter sp. APW13 TaxID=3077236 RepID=UPI0028DF370E|nr:DUF3138 family protein [Curvibacter sp. APW13]MDT8991264.1 DUF3138 family protein [Curvibacter sp. APW13]
MEFKSKLLVVALAAAMPWVSAQAQSQADLQKEIAALRAQLQALQQKVESLNAKTEAPAASAAVAQQVNRLEQRLDLADDEAEKTGFKGMKINGTIEAGAGYDSQIGSNNFGASSGSTLDDKTYSGYGMVQITKETQGEGVDWTLRILPGANQENLVHEASISIPVADGHRVVGGVIPDYQGYEYVFPNANPTLGNQLISHNALYDLAGATQYQGLGMAHTLDGGKYAVKWMIGNVDPSIDTDNDTSSPNTYSNGTKDRSVALAYRGDWFINEFAYIGLSGLHGSVNRNFRIMALDGGYTHGDWQFNGQITAGWMRGAASNTDASGAQLDAEWTGLSALVGYKATPRLQLIARADYLANSKNGGGTYVITTPTQNTLTRTGDDAATGLGPVRASDGTIENAGEVDNGANLTRLTLGTNYQINSNAQWKVEYRIDQSSGHNFVDTNGVATRQRSRIGTALVLSF